MGSIFLFILLLLLGHVLEVVVQRRFPPFEPETLLLHSRFNFGIVPPFSVIILFLHFVDYRRKMEIMRQIKSRLGG